jgi:hypothetical protein
MFQYFPGNYVWSLSTMIALTHGGHIGEVDVMCAPLLEAARAGDDPGTLAFYEAWKGGGDQLIALAENDLLRGHKLSAGEKFGRAALYQHCRAHAGPRLRGPAGDVPALAGAVRSGPPARPRKL